jgi:hypothetical protein
VVRQDDREDIVAERRAIRVVLRLIDLELARAGRTPAESRDIWIRLLGYLHEHLKRHFELEERGGVLGEFEVIDAGTYRDAQEFSTQHRRFIKSLERLLDTLEADRIDGARAPDYFEPELRRLFADLDRHEACELELVQALASQDLGCGD